MLELRTGAVNSTGAKQLSAVSSVAPARRFLRALIVNADDLGWSEGVNRGIATAHREGIVTSASLLASGAAFARAAELARSEVRLGIGVHLNLSDGPPVLPAGEVASLVNAEGTFFAGPGRLFLRRLRGRLALGEAEREWDAQIRKVRDAGISPTHLDGHKHVHMLPGLFEMALRLAARHGIGAIRISLEDASLRAWLAAGDSRPSAMVMKQSLEAMGLSALAMNAAAQARRAQIATADYFCGLAHTGALTAAGVASLLRNLPEGVTELMTHPGYADTDLRASRTRLQASREAEAAILTAPEMRNLVAKLGIRLLHYGFIEQHVR